MTDQRPILIVGAGQAGATTAASLRALGYLGRIVMVGCEQILPYERPPLLKAILSDASMDEQIRIHPAGFYTEQSIDLRLGICATAIDTRESLAYFSDGTTLLFSRCLLATGGRARTLPELPRDSDHVYTLRTLADAHALRQAMQHKRSLLVLGAGFLGLEIASTARSMGLDVTVLESGIRVLPRAVPPAFSDWLERRVRHTGIDLRLGCQCSAFTSQPDGIVVTLADGSTHNAPLLVVAIGLVPDTTLAHASGIEINPLNGGIRIDAQCRTSVSNIFAAGDCTSQFQPMFDEEIRFESWQSANEQARIAAAAMLDLPTENAAVPWFWTDQCNCNVQILGMANAELTYHLRGHQAGLDEIPKFLLLGVNDKCHLRHVIAVNAGGDLRQLSPLMTQKVPCDIAQFCDLSTPLRKLVRETLTTIPSIK